MTFQDILTILRTKPTVSVPFAGMALGELSPNVSYKAAAADRLGVPVMDIGGRRRGASIHVLGMLGFDEAA